MHESGCGIGVQKVQSVLVIEEFPLMLEELKGWHEIRQALLFVESLSTFSKHTLAGVEIYQKNDVSTVRVFVRTVEELDSYLGPIFERMFLNIGLDHDPLAHELDVFSDVYGRIVLDYPYDVNRSHGMMP